MTHACLLGHLHRTRSRELSELRATLAADKGALEGLKKEVNNTDERAQKQVWVPTLDLGTCQLWHCSCNAPGIVCSLGVLCLVMCVPFPQLRAAEQLRDEIRAERERLVGREAAVAAAEASLATHRRDMERQAAEIEHATQVRLLSAVDATHSSRKPACLASPCQAHDFQKHRRCARPKYDTHTYLSSLLFLLSVWQALKEQELVLAERKQALDAATAAAERQQRELAAREAAMSAAATKLEQQQAAAIAASDEIERQHKAIEAARRGLAGVEAALDAREAQLAESWGQLAANAAALKAGDLDGLSLRASVSSCSAAESGSDHTGQGHSVGLDGSSPARLFKPLTCMLCVQLQDFAAPSGIPGVGASSSNSLVHYSQQHSSISGLLLDPSLPPDALAVTLAAKRASLMERESALQVGAHVCWPQWQPHCVQATAPPTHSCACHHFRMSRVVN